MRNSSSGTRRNPLGRKWIRRSAKHRRFIYWLKSCVAFFICSSKCSSHLREGNWRAIYLYDMIWFLHILIVIVLAVMSMIRIGIFIHKVDGQYYTVAIFHSEYYYYYWKCCQRCPVLATILQLRFVMSVQKPSKLSQAGSRKACRWGLGNICILSYVERSLMLYGCIERILLFKEKKTAHLWRRRVESLTTSLTSTCNVERFIALLTNYFCIHSLCDLDWHLT